MPVDGWVFREYSKKTHQWFHHISSLATCTTHGTELQSDARCLTFSGNAPLNLSWGPSHVWDTPISYYGFYQRLLAAFLPYWCWHVVTGTWEIPQDPPEPPVPLRCQALLLARAFITNPVAWTLPGVTQMLYRENVRIMVPQFLLGLFLVARINSVFSRWNFNTLWTISHNDLIFHLMGIDINGHTARK